MDAQYNLIPNTGPLCNDKLDATYPVMENQDMDNQCLEKQPQLNK